MRIMSTGNVNLDILLGQIEADRIENTKQSIVQIMNDTLRCHRNRQKRSIN